MWFWIGYIAYTYMLLFVAALYLIHFIVHQKYTFRSQAIVILAGGMIPWIVSVIYLTDTGPVAGLDLAPISTSMSGILAAYAIFNSKLLDLVPVARETLVETLPDGIMILDSQNRIQDINAAAISFLGINKKNFIGSDADSSGAGAAILMSAAISTNDSGNIEIRKNNSVRTYSILKQSVRNQEGSRLIIIRDITNIKKTEEELIMARDRAEESDRLKSSFLANMSHEIRTPLNGILGFTELLKTSDITNKERQNYLDIITESGDRLLTIINDIIDISKIESGQMEISVSSVNVLTQSASICSFFKHQAEAKGIRLYCLNSLTEEEALIDTDPDKLYAILTNLIKNAIKFTSNGFVEFGFEKKNNDLVFSVKDTGIGISNRQKGIIFERFRQGSDSLTRNYEGTGLGLSISKAYVEMLGGRIWFESEFSKGSVFYFSIPYLIKDVREPVIPESVPDKTPDNVIKKIIVLIVEDDKPSELFLSKLVAPFSKKILKAETGFEAIEMCRNNPGIDLVLMDIELQEMDGYEATRQIRKFNKNLIIIAQTAFGLAGDREKALEAGCNDYIAKPIHTNIFMNLINKYFSKLPEQLAEN